MTPRDRDERQFAEDVDRILRGEEPLSIQDDADYAETLQFAQRLTQLSDDPGEEFAGRLRHRLVVELAEQDAKQDASGSWFVRVFSRPSLRLAVVSTFIVIAAVGFIWRAGMLSPAIPRTDDPAPGIMTTPLPSDPAESDQRAASQDNGMLTMEGAPPAAAPDAALTVVGRVSPSVSFGETVSITMHFSNEGTEPVSVAFFPPAIHIRDAMTGRIVYSFAAGDRGDAIQPMESRSYRVEWDYMSSEEIQVEPGRYMVDVAIATAAIDTEEWTTEVITVAMFDIHDTEGIKD